MVSKKNQKRSNARPKAASKNRTRKEKKEIVPRPMREGPKSSYFHCITGPTNMPNNNSGFPDGDVRPSVTLDFSRVYTFSPVGGEIIIYVCPSFTGLLNLGAGTVTATVVDQAPATGAGYALSTISASSPAYKGQLNETFFNGVLGTLPIPNFTPSYTDYRPLAAVLDFNYTGSSMMDNGSVLISKIPSLEVISGSLVVDATSDYSVDRASFAQPNAAALFPSSKVGAARKGFTLRSVPVRPLYETTAASGDAGLSPFAALSNDTSGTVLTPSYHPQAPWYVVKYSGLDASASITVNYRYCIQAIVASDSPFAPLAAPSPVEAPGMLAAAARHIIAMPVVTELATVAAKTGTKMIQSHLGM